MNLSSLKPASEFARNYGCKAIIYGAPGSAKTPLINTAPRPVLLACEPGMLSMRGSTIPTFEATTPETIDEFFKWFFHSNETKGFDTLAIDSTSHMADIYLQKALKVNAHGLKAYGDMAKDVMSHLRPLFYTKEKHAYLIAKQSVENNMARPYYPGNQLNVDVPHMYDFILHLGQHNVPSMGQIKSFMCNESLDFLARNRTGNLNDFEEPHFGKLVKKAMS